MGNHARYSIIQNYLLEVERKVWNEAQEALKDNNHVSYEHAEDRIHYLTHLRNNLKRESLI